MPVMKPLEEINTGAELEADALLEIVDDAEAPSDDGYIIDDEGNLVEASDEEEAQPTEFGDNLALFMEDTDLNALAGDLIQFFDEDLASRSEWEKTYKKGMELLGFKIEKRTKPWKDACGAFHPLLAEAVIRYSSEAILECFPPSGPADVSILGTITPELLQRKTRVKDELNYQIVHRMPEFRTELEMIFWQQPLAGSSFQKTYFDRMLGRARSVMVGAEDFIVAYGCSDLTTCGRYTERMYPSEMEIKRSIAKGVYKKYDMTAMGPMADEIKDATDEMAQQEESGTLNERRVLLEMYVDLDLKGFEQEVPVNYVVTIDYNQREILAIYRNYNEENIYERNKPLYAHYKYLPGYGFYGTGLAHVLGGLTESATSIMRQLVDAGTLSNIPGGLKARGLRIKGDDNPIRPGEFRDVDVSGGKITDSIAWLPHKEPSAVLQGLLQSLIEEGRRIGSVADAKLADMNQSSPVGTTLAIIERVMRVMSATQARSHVALDWTLKLLAEIIATEMPEKYDYPIEGNYNRKQDFGPPLAIIPVADPAATTVAQRIMRYRAAMDNSTQAPQVYDMVYFHRQMLELLEIKNADRIIPLPDDMKPLDPISEGIAILNGKPVKAFLEQDHESHIKVHMAQINDPMIAAMVGQSPQANMIISGAHAHVQEHLGFAWRRRMEQEMGVQLPPPDQPLPPDQAAQLAAMAAEAADKVLERSKGEAAAMEAQQAQQDPKVMVDMAELEHKNRVLEFEMAEAARKHKEHKEKLDTAKKIAALKAATEDDKIEYKKEELEVRTAEKLATEGARLKNQRQVAKLQTDASKEIAKQNRASRPKAKPKKS